MLLFLLTIPIEDSLAISSELSINRLIGMVAIGAWAIWVIARQRIRRVHPFLLIVLLFIVWNLFSIFWTIDRDLTIIRIKTYIQLGIMCYMVWDLVDSKRRLRIAIQTYVLGAYISVIGTIVNFIKGEEAYLYSGGRYVATGFNANDLAVILALGLPLAWYLVITTVGNSARKWVAVINLLYIPTAFFAIFLTGSRGGFITAMLSLCYILPTVGRMGNKVKIPFSILIVLLMAAAVIIIPDSTMQRIMSTFKSGETDYLGGRLQIFADAAGIISPEANLDLLMADNRLRSFADSTGGAAYFPRFQTELPQIFGNISRVLRTQYSIAYASTNTKKDGKFRKIRVEVQADITDSKGKPLKFKVITRKGYQAKEL